jgi:hypothetical protein
VAGVVQPAFNVVGAGTRPPAHRALLRDLERALATGDLKNSELGPLVLETLQQETDLEVVKLFDPPWITVGIRVADSYFRLIRPSTGQRDWQRDFAKTATPILVGVARSLLRSADAQAVIVRLCEVVAQRLRLTLVWPDDPDELNDLRNAVYRACLDAQEVESDDVLIVLQGLTVIGPS